MSRLIDADKLKAHYAWWDFSDDDDRRNKHVFDSIVDLQPTADVVQVVRCKECKYRKGAFHTDRRRKEGGYWLYWCELDTGDPFELGRNAEDDNWFCADGERRDDEEST